MSGIPYLYLMQKKRIQGKGENNKIKISSFSEGLQVFLIVYSAQEKGFFLCRFFLYQNKNPFSSKFVKDYYFFFIRVCLLDLFFFCLGLAEVVDKQRGRKYGGGQISCDCEQIELLGLFN